MSETAIQRFAKNVRLPRNPSTDCWEWTGTITGRDTGSGGGYPQMTVSGRVRCYAHRYAFTRFVRDLTNTECVDHLCRNRQCVNPEHMEAVDQRTNILRGVGPTAVNASRTHCKRGHELSSDNVRLLGGKSRRGYVSRECLQCVKLRRKGK